MMRVRTRIAPSPLHGVGVFAEEFIPKGTVVWVLDPLDSVLPLKMREAAPPVLREFLDTYAWVHEGKLYLACDNMRFLNHSFAPNCRSDGADPRSVAVRDIAAGEELTEDYSTFHEEWTQHNLG